jgi:hypothetical protein
MQVYEHITCTIASMNTNPMTLTITSILNGFQVSISTPDGENITWGVEHENLNYALRVLLEEVGTWMYENGWCEKCKGFFGEGEYGVHESWNNAGLCPECYEASGF